MASANASFLIFPIIASLFGSLLRRADLLREEEISPVVLFVLFLPMFGARDGPNNVQLFATFAVFRTRS